MYDFGKLTTLLLLGGIILTAMVFTNVTLVLTTLAYPDWLPRQFFGLEFIADNRQRARSVATRYNDGLIGKDESFVVILGLSSASEGITLARLPETIDDGTRFLGLTGGGRNMRDLARYAEPLIASDARPELAVFAINLFHLVDPLTAKGSFVENIRNPATITALRGYWLVDRRKDVKYAVDSAIDRVHNSVFSFFDVRLGQDEDPWREVMRMELAQTTLEQQWQDKLDSYGDRGYYLADNYRRSSDQARLFSTLVGDFRDRGTDVVVILLPEHSRLRERIPPDAMNLLDEALRQEFVIDLRDTIADTGFADISHMNEQGRQAFARLFADEVARQLATIRK